MKSDSVIDGADRQSDRLLGGSGTFALMPLLYALME